MQRVVSLQLEAFWQRHSGKLLAVGGVLLVYMLWRTFFGMAKVFINLSDTVAASGFMVRPILLYTMTDQHPCIGSSRKQAFDRIVPMEIFDP